jgi:putative nucleotidyltransferase with HDIG domain
MVVDDHPAVLESLTHFLQRLGYPVKGFVDPADARRALEAGESVHLLVTDLAMPGIQGIDLIQSALEADPTTVAIVVTGVGEVESAAEALRLGVVDYLLKPVDLTLLGLAVQRALRTRAQSIFHREAYGRLRADVEIKSAEVERKNAELESITLTSLSALVQLLEARSPHFQDHSQAVSRLAAAMATVMELPSEEVEAVRVAGLLHDIGMIAVPDSIIDKHDKLTDQEFARVREHPRLAEEVLRPFPNLGRAVDYVLFHHERLNGSGYPEGRRSRDIPLGAQIVGVADSYVALLETRAFREAVSEDEAIAMLRGAEGNLLAGKVLDALEASLEVA